MTNQIKPAATLQKLDKLDKLNFEEDIEFLRRHSVQYQKFFKSPRINKDRTSLKLSMKQATSDKANKVGNLFKLKALKSSNYLQQV